MWARADVDHQQGGEAECYGQRAQKEASVGDASERSSPLPFEIGRSAVVVQAGREAPRGWVCVAGSLLRCSGGRRIYFIFCYQTY